MIIRQDRYFAIADFFCGYWLYFFYAACAWVGLVIVAPTFSEITRVMVFSNPFLRSVHLFFFGLGFYVLIPFFIYALVLYVAFLFEPKFFPGGWGYESEGAMPRPCEVVEKRLLPNSPTEEFIFITWLIGILFMTFWLPQVVGGLISFSIITWVK